MAQTSPTLAKSVAGDLQIGQTALSTNLFTLVWNLSNVLTVENASGVKTILILTGLLKWRISITKDNQRFLARANTEKKRFLPESPLPDFPLLLLLKPFLIWLVRVVQKLTLRLLWSILLLQWLSILKPASRLQALFLVKLVLKMSIMMSLTQRKWKSKI